MNLFVFGSLSWQISSNSSFQRNVGFDLERAQTSEHCSRTCSLLLDVRSFLSLYIYHHHHHHIGTSYLCFTSGCSTIYVPSWLNDTQDLLSTSERPVIYMTLSSSSSWHPGSVPYFWTSGRLCDFDGCDNRISSPRTSMAGSGPATR